MVRHARRVCAVSSVVLLVASGCGSASEPDAGDAACPPEQKRSGVYSPTQVEPEKSYPDIEIADSGFTVAKSKGKEIVTYGLLIENNSDLVLYDATIRVEFRDSDGNDPLEKLVENSSAPGLSTRKLEEVPIPVLMPGEQLGLGDWVETWDSMLWTETGDTLELEHPDYDDLSIDIALLSGELWPEHNDVHKFVPAETSDVSIQGTSEFESSVKYHGGEGIGEYELSAKVEYEGCKRSWGFSDSSLLYGEDGAIVGGGVMVGFGNQGALFPGIRENEDLVPAWGPEGDLTAEVFQYAKPLPVNVAQ